jgi:serine/threonine protein kinase/formylglycine-generating enzyme required for sulfatase activity/cephalosporin-C deacetylase-like acetyl esterase
MEPSASETGKKLEHFERLVAALGQRYRLERELGAGGMATVLLAQDLKHHRKVAIKVLDPALAAGLGTERFLREIEIAAMLTHPHILPLHDSGEIDGFLFYVMPFVEGETLRERLAREGPLSVPETVRLLSEIVDALAYAHGQGVVHRDMKPGNVMLAGRHALVADFGIAKAVHEAGAPSTITAFGMVVGTPQYMAPEQAAGETFVDHRADIYAVGVIAYQMLTGSLPFSGTTQQVLLAQMNTSPQPIANLRAGIPPELAQAVMRCLKKNPADRWQNAAELLARLEALATSGEGVTVSERAPLRAGRRLRRWPWLVGAIALIAALAGSWRLGLLGGRHDSRWVHAEAIPRIQALADSDHFLEATMLAMEADAIAAGDPSLVAVWRKFARRATISSSPPGASIFWKEDNGGNGPWFPLGKTPLEMWFPRGVYRLRLELAGYRPYEGLGVYWWLATKDWAFPLDRLGTISDELVHVPGGKFELEVPGSSGAIESGDFLLDKYEVTNRRYQAFVDAGGYEDARYWEHPFLKEGRVLAWKEAIEEFKDRTGRPGPSTWELSSYPRGQEDFPVAGVSWFEAAAFAAFEKRDLPSVYHWQRAAGLAAAEKIVPLSNFADKGPARVGQYHGLSWFGAWDMAGNVREWCFNKSGRSEERFILGGGWNDPTWAFGSLTSQSPWDRSPTNGIRLATLGPSTPKLEASRQPIEEPFRDFSKERPVDDAEFAIYRRLYAYDHKPLNALIERTEVAGEWTRQKVSFDAAYGNERVIAYVHLPRKGRPPYQTVLYFPGWGATFLNSIDQDFNHWDPIVRSGRALVFPIYRGTFERKTVPAAVAVDGSVAYRDQVIEWAKDLGRTVDYLESSSEFDAQHLGYFGHSWGAAEGGIMLAVEPRLKAAVLHVAGLYFRRALPEADALNFLPRVKVPVLMMNGRYDGAFPLETSQAPMFRLLGTPPDRKRHQVYETGHVVPRAELTREMLDWYDRYLGPVSTTGKQPWPAP